MAYLVRTVKENWPAAATVAGAFAAWELGVRFFKVPEYVVPPPSAAILEMVRKWDMLWPHFMVTFTEMVASFLISAVIGIVVGIMVVYSRTLERAIYPLLVGFQTVPKVALAPMLLLWFGFGIWPKILVGVLVAFFPVVISTAVGLWSMDPELVPLARSMGASSRDVFLKFRLPSAVPNIFAGLKVSISLSVVGVVVGEFVGTEKGLGYVLLYANGNLQSKLLFAAVLLLTIMGVASYWVMELVETFATGWHRAKTQRFLDTM